MMYIWWVVSVLLLCAWAIIQSMPVPLGQRRVLAILRFVQTVVAVAFTILWFSLYSWTGAALSIVALAAALALSRFRYIHSIAQWFYNSYISKLLPWAARHSWLDYFSERTAVGKKIGLETYDELVSVVDNAPFLRKDEAKILKAVIATRDDTAKNHMVPLSSIPTIHKSDIVGPLLLDELHKTNQSDFAVIDDSGSIVGTAQLKHLIEMSRVSSVVGDVMQPHVYRVRPGILLHELVAAMVAHNAWLAIVNDGEDLGVVSLDAILEALLGKPQK